MQDTEDRWQPTRPEKPHRRTGPGCLTPEQLALADDLHTRALALRAASEDGISIREAVALAANDGLALPWYSGRSRTTRKAARP